MTAENRVAFGRGVSLMDETREGSVEYGERVCFEFKALAGQGNGVFLCS